MEERFAKSLSCISLVLTVMCAGCASRSLVRDLQERGVTYLNTARIVVQTSDSEGCGCIEIATPHEIQEIWTSIFQARPYSLWYASGFRELRFYTTDNWDHPKVVMIQNGSGEMHFESLPPGEGYYCPGLFDYFMPYLKEIAEKRDAVVSGDLEKVKALMKGDPWFWGDDGNADSPLHWAASYGQVAVAKLILDHEAGLGPEYKKSVYDKNYMGSTPLHLVAAKGYKDVVKLLLANNAEVNAKDKNGKTPFALARINGHKDVAELLRQHGGTE